MNKRSLYLVSGLLVVCLLVVVGLFWYVSYRNSLQNVTISFDTNIATLNLYRSKGGDSSIEKQGSIIRSIKSDETFTLERGSYVVEASGKNIKPNPTNVTVGDTPVTRTIYISYSDSYLDQLLSQAHDAILQSIIAGSNKNLQFLYTVEQGKLYGYGDWYGTTLTYKGLDTDNRDSLHIILHKISGQWAIVTKSPAISLSIQENKNIPSYILRDVNQYKNRPSTPPAMPAPDYVVDDGSPGAR